MYESAFSLSDSSSVHERCSYVCAANNDPHSMSKKVTFTLVGKQGHFIKCFFFLSDIYVTLLSDNCVYIFAESIKLSKVMFVILCDISNILCFHTFIYYI